MRVHHKPLEGAEPRGESGTSMVITSVTYDGETITVNWAEFTEEGLSGYIVTINQVDVRLDNYAVNDPAKTSRAIGYSLQAGASYQCWVTPTTTPLRIPDIPHASDPVPIPYST